MTPTPPAPLDLVWEETPIEPPRMITCHADLFGASVDYDPYDGEWTWDAHIRETRGGIAVKRGSGGADNEDDGKRKAAEWLKANL